MRMGLTALAVFALDFATKLVVKRYMVPGETIPIIPGVFNLTHVRNPGAAFGLLANRTTFFVVITVLVIALILYYSKQIAGAKTLVSVSLGLQLGGAVGNLLDRVRFGVVTDFFDFHYWPVFNIADSAIVVGVGLFFLQMWTQMKHEGKPG